MIKKTIKFEDFDGNPVEKDYYFHLSKAELIELDVNEDGLSDNLKTITKSNDNKQILGIFKKIILLAVGERSEDGQRFIKNADIRDAFEQSPAYSEMFLEFFTTPGAAIEFIQGMLPRDMSAEVAKQYAEERKKLDAPPTSA